jgi:hypothetical protein
MLGGHSQFPPSKSIEYKQDKYDYRHILRKLLYDNYLPSKSRKYFMSLNLKVYILIIYYDLIECVNCNIWHIFLPKTLITLPIAIKAKLNKLK